MIILIQDIQNKRPYFTGLPFNAVIPEESAVGTTVSALMKHKNKVKGNTHNKQRQLIFFIACSVSVHKGASSEAECVLILLMSVHHS